MIVTFRSKAHADIMMFGDIAISVLKLMGHSGTVPGALLAEEVPTALDHLTHLHSPFKKPFIVTFLVKTPAFRRERLQSLAVAMTPSYH